MGSDGVEKHCPRESPDSWSSLSIGFVFTSCPKWETPSEASPSCIDKSCTCEAGPVSWGREVNHRAFDMYIPSPSSLQYKGLIDAFNYNFYFLENHKAGELCFCWTLTFCWHSYSHVPYIPLLKIVPSLSTEVKVSTSVRLGFRSLFWPHHSVSKLPSLWSDDDSNLSTSQS